MKNELSRPDHSPSPSPSPVSSVCNSQSPSSPTPSPPISPCKVHLKTKKTKTLKQLLTILSILNPSMSLTFLNDLLSFRLRRDQACAVLDIYVSEFFHEYHYDLPSPLKILITDLRLIVKFLMQKAVDDDEVVIFLPDDPSPATHLHVLVQNEGTKKSESEVFEIKEMDYGAYALPTYDFVVGIKPQDCQKILQHSAQFKEPIHITITCSWFTLSSGSELISYGKDDADCGFKGVPAKMHYEVQMSLHKIARGLYSALSLANVIYFRDHIRGNSDESMPSLELRLGEFSTLQIYFPKAYTAR